MTRPIAERREEYIHLQLPNLPPITYVLPLEDAVAVRDALTAALPTTMRPLESQGTQPSPSAGEVLGLLREALDAAIQCETDVLDCYSRDCARVVLDEAVADLRRDSLPKLRKALAAIPDSGLSGIPAISDKPMPEREALAEAASAVLGEFDDGYLRPMATYDQRERLTVTKEAVGRLRAALVRLTAPAAAGGEP